MLTRADAVPWVPASPPQAAIDLAVLRGAVGAPADQSSNLCRLVTPAHRLRPIARVLQRPAVCLTAWSTTRTISARPTATVAGAPAHERQVGPVHGWTGAAGAAGSTWRNCGTPARRAPAATTTDWPSGTSRPSTPSDRDSSDERSTRSMLYRVVQHIHSERNVITSLALFVALGARRTPP